MKKFYLSFLLALLPLLVNAAVIEIDGIFYNLVSKLKTVEVVKNPNMKYGSYSGDVVIPEAIYYAGVKHSVTSINDNAFIRCKGLTSVTIPNSVTSIGNFAFSDCSGLTSVTIPNSVTSIGICAFTDCTGLTSITIPNSVTSISDKAFYGCTGLTSIMVESGNTIYDSRDNCNAIIETASNNLIVGCYNTIIPSSVTSIRDEAFYGCTGLTSITIPNSVTSIGEWTFSGCNKLTSITIGSGIETISYCAFRDCPELTDVYCNAKNAPETNEDAFEGSSIEYATLHVPEGSIDAYKAMSPWNQFKNIVAIQNAKVELNKSKATLLTGKTLTLKATVLPETLEDKSVTWKSSNKKVATVSSKGKVKGIKAGTATITCTSKATGETAKCKITVINGTVTLNKTELFVEKGTKKSLKATVTPTTLEDKSVTWTSSNKKIATVSSTGKVKGVKYGTAIITCTSKATGAKATCTVTVGKVVLGMDEFTLKRSREIMLFCTLYPEDLADKTVTWKSSNEKIATVTSDGRVKGIKAGTATITCTSVATGLTGTCTVTVLDKTESRSLEADGDGTTAIDNLGPAATAPFDVYDLSGRKVLTGVTSLDGLPNGVYIVNGKKMLKQ